MTRISQLIYSPNKNNPLQNGIAKSTFNRSAVASYDHSNYTNQVSIEGKATAQKSSGRCWIFACLNVIRVEMMRKYDLPESFELSQTYVFFWDKLERANFFLESMIQTRDEPLDGRLMTHLLSNTNLMSDGGQWDMLSNLITKYGLVPKSKYPDPHAATSSRAMNLFLREKLRKFACELRSFKTDEEAKKAKPKMLEAIFEALVIFLGEPPRTFDWTFTSKKKEKKTLRGLTGQAFLKDIVPYDFKTKISLINDPRNEYYKLYTVDYLGNVVGGSDVRYINVRLSFSLSP